MDDIRRGRYWLLSAQLGAILPLWNVIPWWLTALMALACFWRLPRIETIVPPPGFWVRISLLALGLYGLFLSFRTLLGPEAGTAFLVLCMTLKVLEMRSRRDCYVAIILGFFVVATNFFFSQSLVTTLYVGLILVLILAALLSLNQPASTGSGAVFRRALVLLAQAIPLMLILFLFFPRLPPLWTLNIGNGTAKTGMSDSMAPGDIAKLSQSDALAFRVEFEGRAPEKSKMYWRGLVLSDFDGVSWRQNEDLVVRNTPAWPVGNAPFWVNEDELKKQSPLYYRVIQEPTEQPWLFALNLPKPTAKESLLTREFTLLSPRPLFARTTYNVTSYLEAPLDLDLPPWLRSQTLALPEKGNELSRRLAMRWRSEGLTDRQLIVRALNYFKGQNFSYTLEPPALGKNRIDDFLFNTQRGFCEHYSSAFTYLMRAADIPARVVVGYHGGQESPYGDYWLIRQLDAHAWVEVWLEGEGWIQLDPTSMVAPERIENGMGALVAQRDFWGESGLSGLRYNSFHLFKGVKQWADYVNYRWHTDVLGYDSRNQDNLMRRLLGDASVIKRLLLMVGLFVGVLVLILLSMYWRRPRKVEREHERYYRQYTERMAKMGMAREHGEGVRAYAERIGKRHPAAKAQAKQVADLYTQIEYKRSNENAHWVRKLKQVSRQKIKPR